MSSLKHCCRTLRWRLLDTELQRPQRAGPPQLGGQGEEAAGGEQEG